MSLFIFKQKQPLIHDKKRLVTSFYPLYYFTQQVAGDNFEIINLAPAGVEPHDYELSSDDLIKMENSKAVFVNGQGFEPWIDQVKDHLTSKNVQVVPVTNFIETLEAIDEEGHQTIDPHIWLDPSLAIQEVDIITSTVIEIDPDNQSFYQAKSNNLKQRLNLLDQEFQRQLALCPQKTIISSHNAFGYLAKRYGFEQISILGLSPEEDPSPKQIAQVVDLARKNNIRYIFFETLVSPKLADTIAKEVGAQTLVFNPIEGLTADEQIKGEDYFSIQAQNLQNLKLALNCQP